MTKGKRKHFRMMDIFTILICGDVFTGLYICQTLLNGIFLLCAVCYMSFISQSNFFLQKN